MYKKQKGDQLTLEKIQAAYHASARIVTLYGDRYLPLFERMHKELKKAETALEMKALAMQIGTGRK